MTGQYMKQSVIVKGQGFYPFQKLYINNSGSYFNHIPLMNSKLRDIKLPWIMRSLLSKNKLLWGFVNIKQTPFSGLPWQGQIFRYLENSIFKCMIWNRYRRENFKDPHINTIGKLASKFQGTHQNMQSIEKLTGLLLEHFKVECITSVDEFQSDAINENHEVIIVA